MTCRLSECAGESGKVPSLLCFLLLLESGLTLSTEGELRRREGLSGDDLGSVSTRFARFQIFKTAFGLLALACLAALCFGLPSGGLDH
jgi:hypothetical protein